VFGFGAFYNGVSRRRKGVSRALEGWVEGRRKNTIAFRGCGGGVDEGRRAIGDHKHQKKKKKKEKPKKKKKNQTQKNPKTTRTQKAKPTSKKKKKQPDQKNTKKNHQGCKIRSEGRRKYKKNVAQEEKKKKFAQGRPGGMAVKAAPRRGGGVFIRSLEEVWTGTPIGKELSLRKGFGNFCRPNFGFSVWGRGEIEDELLKQNIGRCRSSCQDN